MPIKFSIITCTWNSVDTLQQTLDSVASQEGCDVEHIFVDGGSTDGTLELIERYGRADVVIENVRGGISRAMNEGVRRATGDVIAHLHSDDYFYGPRTLASVEDAFSKYSSRWLAGRISTLRDGVLTGPQPQRKFNPSLYRSRGYFIAHPATFLKRSLFEEVGGFDERFRYAMDIDLWLRLIAIESPIELNEILTVFREHPGSLSTSQRREARLEERRVRMADPHISYLEKALCAFRLFRSLRSV